MTLEVGNLSRTVDVRVSATRVDRATLSCAEDGSGQSETGVCRVRVGASQPVLLDLLGDGQPAFGFEPTWTMADKKVARLDGGAIRGVSPGRTKLSVEVGGARAELEVDVWPLACSEKVESKLTYIVGHRGVQLECKVKDPEPCIDFFIKRKWSVPEALGGCCCVGARW